MRIAKEDVPVRIDAPGAIARQKTDFGDVTGYGKMGAEYFSFGAGTDITELLRGDFAAIYTDGEEETSRSGDLFYWPPGHSVRAEADTDIVMFSPEHEHGEVIDHIRRQVSG